MKIELKWLGSSPEAIKKAAERTAEREHLTKKGKPRRPHCAMHPKYYSFCGICHAISLVCKTQEEWLKRRVKEEKRIKGMKL